MEFAFTHEQEELRRQARSFLEANRDAPLAGADAARYSVTGWLRSGTPP